MRVVHVFLIVQMVPIVHNVSFIFVKFVVVFILIMQILLSAHLLEKLFLLTLI